MLILAGEEEIHELGGEVTVTIPYILREGETAESVVVYHVDDGGVRHPMKTTYDTESREVTFVTDHFSYYVIGLPEGASAPADVTFELTPGNAIATVVDVAGITVGAVSDGGILSLVPGTYRVTVTADGYMSRTGTLVVEAGTSAFVYPMSLAPVEPEPEPTPTPGGDDPYVPPVPPVIVYPDEVNVNLDDGGIDTTGILACAAAACAAAIFAMFAVFEYRRR